MPVRFEGVCKGDPSAPAAEVDLFLAKPGDDERTVRLRVKVNPDTGLASIFEPVTAWGFHLTPQSMSDLSHAFRVLADAAAPMRVVALKAASPVGESPAGDGQTVTDSRGATRPL